MLIHHKLKELHPLPTTISTQRSVVTLNLEGKRKREGEVMLMTDFIQRAKVKTGIKSITQSIAPPRTLFILEEKKQIKPYHSSSFGIHTISNDQ